MGEKCVHCRKYDRCALHLLCSERCVSVCFMFLLKMSAHFLSLLRSRPFGRDSKRCITQHIGQRHHNIFW